MIDEVRRGEKDVTNAILKADPRNVEKCSNGEVAQDTLRQVGRSWYCSQVGDESEERCDGLAQG